MEWTYIVAIGVAVVAFAEMIQVILLNVAVRRIDKKLETIIPEGVAASKILSDMLFQFMNDLQTDPQKREVVGGFIRGAALAGYDELSKKIPMLGGSEKINSNLEKLVAKNPWAGLALGIGQAVAPMVKERLEIASQQQKGGVKQPEECRGWG